jgi:AcrR family transcriptional regulator
MAATPHDFEDRLDERLVQVALQLLDDEGLERLTLRRLARRAGVSHSAPLRHFSSLAELLSEVAARGFELLSESIEKSGAQLPAPVGALPKLVAAGRAYVECAIAHPGLFALMVRPEALASDNERLARTSRVAFEQLVRHVRASQDTGWHADLDTRVLSGSVWAAVHGLATLWSQGAFVGAVPGASLDDAIATTLQLFVDSHPGDPT